MPKVNLELQMKFLKELNEALEDALGRYASDGPDKLAELEYMKKEVVRARRIISERMDREETTGKSAFQTEAYHEAAYL